MIEKLEIQNVMGFESFSNPSPFPAITIILGKNDVCKTGLIKMMYAVGKSSELYEKHLNQGGANPFRQFLSEKVQSVYGIKRNLGELIRKNGSPKKLSVKMMFNGGRFHEVTFSYGTDTKTSIIDPQIVPNTNQPRPINYIFIPAKEVLTAFNTIKAISRQFFFPGWDDTTLDLIDLLDIPTRDEENIPFADVLRNIKELFSGELKQISSNERFVYKKNGAEFSLPLTAEGVKHIGVLATLIENGQIREGSVLFLDEPEDNLHPGALRQLVKILAMFAQKGVQIFLTTHNYFTLKQLQIEARKNAIDVMCCGLKRSAKGLIDVQFSNLREGMPSNEIVEESLAMFDEDIETELNSGL